MFHYLCEGAQQDFFTFFFLAASRRTVVQARSFLETAIPEIAEKATYSNFDDESPHHFIVFSLGLFSLR